MSIDMEQFHQAFFEESFEGLDIMEAELLNLDVGTADVEVVNTIFRAAHSIKGGAGTFGFMNVSEFTHVMETLLDEMREGVRPVTQASMTALLESVDTVRHMLEAVRDGTDLDEEDVVKHRVALEAILAGSDAASVAESTAASADEPAESDAASTSTETGAGWRITFKPHSNMLMTGNDPVRMLRSLEDLGELTAEADLSDLPPFADMVPEDAYISWVMTLTGYVSEADVQEVFEWVEDECDLLIEPLVGKPAKEFKDPAPVVALAETSVAAAEPKPEPEVVAAAPAPAPAPEAPKPVAATAKAEPKQAAKKPASSEAASIRVGIDKVDEIINLVGELVITQSMLDQAGAELEECFENGADSSDRDHSANILIKLREGLKQLERNTRELQEGVMRIRMLPISFVFSRMPRLVHDLSGKLNKKINLVVTGEETELDKTVMENIGDPMVHLVRNALDHGIETPEKRVAAGKPETGTMQLNAYHQGGNIVIEISDDGAGINKQRVLNKAIEKGVISPDDQLTDDEINNLIFAPGFSTAEVVSDVSGRGVGMDVVRTSINRLGGQVEVKSEEGVGSTFTIRLPLTLAILDGQLVSVGDATYVIPLVSIVESLQIERSQINVVAGKAEVYKLRDDYIPIIRSRRVFSLQDDQTNLHGALMVVVEADGTHAGLIVDDLMGQQQVVIKSLETNYRKVDGISGATILGDGTVALILDVAEMVKMNSKKRTPPSGSRQRLSFDSQAA